MDIAKKTKTPPKSGMSGSPKKGGAGGKGTWGKPGMDDLNLAKADRNDPDFESDEEDEKVHAHLEPIPHPVDTPTEKIIKEFFVEAEESEVARRIKEEKIIKSDFVQKAVYLAMEQQAYERELVSKMLSHLRGSTIASEDFAEGFQTALDKLDDASLDIPEAAQMLGKFIARAIVDEIVPPAFLKSCSSESNLAKDAVALATGLINDSHRSRKLEHVWGPGDLFSVKRIKQEVHKIIEEYIANEDRVEADHALRKLNAPSYNFQFVRYSIRAAVGSHNVSVRNKVLDLLSFFLKEGLLSDDNVSRGFEVYRT